MDATLRLRPLFAVSACLLPMAAATAGEPCEGDCYETPAICAPTLDECDSDACGDGSCLTGAGSRYGRGGSGGGCRVIGKSGWGRDNEGHGEWFDDEHDTGPVGSSQKCKHGKMWPPYPRPAENGEWSTQYHAATYWPHPYNCWDRAWVKQASATQIANGWTQATTMYAYHFDAETQQLNPAGQIHLQWILEQCPAQYRTIYVQGGGPRTISDARMAAVASEAAMYDGAGSTPIQVRPVQLAGRPATEVDKIRRSELETMPRPRVSVSAAGSSAGGAGAAGAGSGIGQ